MRKKPTVAHRCNSIFKMSLKSYLKSAKKSGRTLKECAETLGCSYSYIHLLADNLAVKFKHANAVKRQR